jgi:hypothetical protein
MSTWSVFVPDIEHRRQFDFYSTLRAYFGGENKKLEKIAVKPIGPSKNC